VRFALPPQSRGKQTKEHTMSISNRNGAITVSDIIRGHVIAQTYHATSVYTARLRFAAYVRKHCGEVHYA
jgi:hypothetical protein